MILAYDFRWEIVWEHHSELISGLWLTLQVAALAFVVACVLGLPAALMRMSSSPLLNRPAALWIALMRGVPLIVFLYWIYFAAASRGWFTLSEFRSGVVALGLTGSGYMAENYRGALQSVDSGQHEAAINVLIGLLKGATIVSVIGLADMFYVARTVSFDTFSPFELYSAAAVIVIGVTLVTAFFSWLLERQLARSDR